MHSGAVTASLPQSTKPIPTRNIVAILDSIPGAFEHAMQTLERARAGETLRSMSSDLG
jgi:hypothetical protein